MAIVKNTGSEGGSGGGDSKVQKKIVKLPLPKTNKVNQGKPLSEAESPNTIGIFGAAGTGKTLLAAAVSKQVPVLLFDLESGVQSLKSPNNQHLLDAANIQVQSIYDTVEVPQAAIVLRHLFAGKKAALCTHGFLYTKCPKCESEDDKYTIYDLTTLPQDTMIIVDSGTQLDTSVRTIIYGSKMDHGFEGKIDKTYGDWDRLRRLWDYYLTELQTAHLKNFRVLMIFHEEESGSTVAPLVGTRDFGKGIIKYFGSMLRTYVKDGKYMIQCTAEGGRGTCKNRAGLPEGSIQNGEDLLKLFEETTHVDTP